MPMKLECDRCTHQQDTDSAMERSEWLVLYKWDNEGDLEYFCGTPCLLAHAAQFEVPATVPNE
jgi:hypothetical protein